MRGISPRWKQICGAVVAAVLLLPLPAVADLTFGTWTQTSGIPGWTWSDSSATNSDVLTINPVSGTGPATFQLVGSVTANNLDTIEAFLIHPNMTVSGSTIPNLVFKVQVGGVGFIYSPTSGNNQFSNQPVTPIFGDQLTLDKGDG